ncbi:MAG: family acetyltransferase [Parcubacteria group bacterium]|nr:family acetyltransferase [Parcubacteria group bacterium]
MIETSIPEAHDAEGINEVIKQSWYATYVTPEIGVTRKDVDLLYAEYEARQIEAFRQRALHPIVDDISLVAKDSEKVLGYIRFKVLENEIELRTLYILPGETGRGIGTMLWEEGMKLLPAGIPIFTEPVEHTRAVDFYKKIGFVDMGERYKAPETLPDSGISLPLMKMLYTR